MLTVPAAGQCRRSRAYAGGIPKMKPMMTPTARVALESVSTMYRASKQAYFRPSVHPFLLQLSRQSRALSPPNKSDVGVHLSKLEAPCWPPALTAATGGIVEGGKGIKSEELCRRIRGRLGGFLRWQHPSAAGSSSRSVGWDDFSKLFSPIRAGP